MATPVALAAILSAKAQGDAAPYTALLRQLNGAEPAAATQILQALAECASCVLPEVHAKLVDVVLRQRWRNDPSLADATLAFVQELTSAAPGFLRACVDALVRSFLPEEERKGRRASLGQPEAAAAAAAPAAMPAAWLAPRVHKALQGILRACPLATGQLFSCLKEHFPHRRRDLQCHREYLTQTLHAASYAEAVLPRLMHMLVERLVELDVELTLQQRELEEGEDAGDDDIFEVEVHVTSSEEAEKMRLNANKLDAMLVLMFDFIERACLADGTPAAAPHQPPAQSARQQLFESLLSAFETSLLHTYKCKCTQFLLFYCCSFDGAFARGFVHVLLTQVRSEQLHTEARIASAAYLASFVARARYLPLEAVQDAVSQLLLWALDYQRFHVERLAGQPVALDVQLHGVFYSAVQGLLYVLCFKQTQLGTPEAAVFRTTMMPQLQALLDGALNPLKFCQENVVTEFEKLRLCDCAHIIAANERTAVGSHNVGGGVNRLDDFFPFDPLLLKQASERIQPLYKTWEPRPDDARDSRPSNCSSDIATPLGQSLQGMSITPDDLDAIMRQRLREHAQTSFLGNGHTRAGGAAC